MTKAIIINHWAIKALLLFLFSLNLHLHFFGYRAPVSNTINRDCIRPLPAQRFKLDRTCFPHEEHSRTFGNIYSSGSWQHTPVTGAKYYYTYGKQNPADRKSSSGFGSNVGCPSSQGLVFLSEAIAEYNLTTMIDMPCGDVNWQFDSMEVDRLYLYLGLDVATNVIEQNKERFSHHNNKLFAHWDASVCNLPRFEEDGKPGTSRTFDLVHVRDVVQHLSIDMAAAFMESVQQSGALYLVATTFPDGRNDVNISTGSFFRNNLDIPPFNLPKPIRCVKSHCETFAFKREDDLTCLYSLAK